MLFSLIILVPGLHAGICVYLPATSHISPLTSHLSPPSLTSHLSLLISHLSPLISHLLVPPISSRYLCCCCSILHIFLIYCFSPGAGNSDFFLSLVSDEVLVMCHICLFLSSFQVPGIYYFGCIGITSITTAGDMKVN